MSFLLLRIFLLSNFVSICFAIDEYSNKTGIWKNGVIHYSIRSEDYDLHSKQLIMSAFRKIEQETCLRFYLTEIRPDSVSTDKHLYLHNEDKMKQCLRGKYDYNNKVLKMTIGYNCLNEHEIANIFMDMLKAGVTQQPDNLPNTLSYDSSEKTSDTNHLLTYEHHSFMNKYYKKECENFKSFTSRRQMDTDDFETEIRYTQQNEEYYKDKRWPFGIVMYGIDQSAQMNEALVSVLKKTMGVIEKRSCILFEDISDLGQQMIQPKNVIWFSSKGAGSELGFKKGKQVIEIYPFVEPVITPAHHGHLLLNLLRVIGVPFESSRYDRDHYITVNTKHILPAYEQLFDKEPQESYLHMPYDFESVTHPPVNWLCKDACNMGQQTIQPLDDFQWKITMSMGHRADLSPLDILKLNLIYKNECTKREGGEQMEY